MSPPFHRALLELALTSRSNDEGSVVGHDLFPSNGQRDIGDSGLREDSEMEKSERTGELDCSHSLSKLVQLASVIWDYRVRLTCRPLMDLVARAVRKGRASKS